MKTRIIKVVDRYFIQVQCSFLWWKRWRCVKLYNSDYGDPEPLSLAIKYMPLYSVTTLKKAKLHKKYVDACYNNKFEEVNS